MKIMSRYVYVVLVCLISGSTTFGGEVQEVLTFRGTSDASAAVALGEDMFIVADDENNVLRVYNTDKGGKPIFSHNLKAFLGVEPGQPEADIEGATMIGHRIYWITSHGRNKEGKIRSSRYRFFATDVDVEGQKVTVRPVGKPCETLAHELVKDRIGRGLGLDKATRFDAADLKKKDREKLAPKEEGLNIEALCASADGGTIYIGFRNPRPAGGLNHKPHALIVPLENASEIIEDGKTPVFGEPILWDLRGLGIRSMEYSGFHRAYLVAGGPGDEGSDFFLYRWSGIAKERPILIRPLNLGIQFTPEALIPFAGSGRFLLLSDDGSIPVKVSGPHECAKGQYRKDGTCQNKYLLDSGRKTFRGIWLRL